MKSQQSTFGQIVHENGKLSYGQVTDFILHFYKNKYFFPKDGIRLELENFISSLRDRLAEFNDSQTNIRLLE